MNVFFFFLPPSGQVAATAEHGYWGPQVQVAEAECSGPPPAVCPPQHHRRVCLEGGAGGRGEDAQVSAQAGIVSWEHSRVEDPGAGGGGPHTQVCLT